MPPLRSPLASREADDLRPVSDVASVLVDLGASLAVLSSVVAALNSRMAGLKSRMELMNRIGAKLDALDSRTAGFESVVRIGDMESSAERLASGLGCLSAGIDALRTSH